MDVSANLLPLWFSSLRNIFCLRKHFFACSTFFKVDPVGLYLLPAHVFLYIQTHFQSNFQRELHFRKFCHGDMEHGRL